MKGHMVRGLSDISSMSSICDFDIQPDMCLRNEILSVKAKADNTSPALKSLGVHILWKCCKDLFMFMCWMGQEAVAAPS